MVLEILSSAERAFMDHYAQETLALEQGPAFRWLREHRIGLQDIRSCIEARQFELAAQDAIAYPPKPDRFALPWKSKDDLLQRCEELEGVLESHQKAWRACYQPPCSNG